jgi:2-methylcitrate dehydratase PrpD
LPPGDGPPGDAPPDDELLADELSVTAQVAEWVVGVAYDDAPTIAVERVRDRVLDSLGNQFAGMSVSTGRLLAEWVRAQGAAPQSTVTAAGFKTTPALATLVNGAASHALENDDIATFSSHPNSPLTAAALALGEHLGASGRDCVLAWLVGWEVTAQTMKVCVGPKGNDLVNRGWFNQGFQETLGVAALAAKLLRLDVPQTRMALGNAASAMSGLMKNRGSDTKGFNAGSAAMHGVIAGELSAGGFTANPDILDGDIGVARLLGLDNGDPRKILDGLGSWDMATRGSTIRLHACCGASHWSMDALQHILRRRPVAPDELDAIEVEIADFLTDMVPYHEPVTGLEAKYSIEYGLATIVLDGRAGIHQYGDDAVRRPEARALMQRVKTVPMTGGPLQSRVVLRLKNGEELAETVSRAHGTPADPLTRDEILGKFHECAGTLVPPSQRDRIIDLCGRLETLDDIRILAETMGTVER